MNPLLLKIVSDSKRTNGSRKSLDDLVMIQMKQIPHRGTQLCNDPRLGYLNLLDHEGKLGDFQSSTFEHVCLNGIALAYPKSFEGFSCFSMFNFFVKYLKDIPRDSIDLQAIDQRISNAAEKLQNCDSHLLQVIFEETIRMYYDSPSEMILLPVILKHLCTYKTLITYAVAFILNFCKEDFLRGLLDACIETRFSFWTIWQRNGNSSIIPICPVTQAYSSAMLDTLKVLLDYGFHQTHQRVRTLEIVLDEYSGHYNYLWLKQFLFNDGQSSRDAVIDEVFLFVTFIFESFTNSKPIGKCFLLNWAARKDPYVTKQELLDSIERFFGRLSLLRSEEYRSFRCWFQECYHVFQTLLPRYQGLTLRPRSLKHLCRCTIRSALNDNWNMPHGVARLPIPNTMKPYILLK